MSSALSLIDILKVDKDILAAKNSVFVFYTGIAVNDIPTGTVFNRIYDSKYPDKEIIGHFRIEKILMLNKILNYIPKGYHAVVFISSNIHHDEIVKVFDMNENGNFKHVCILE